MNKKIKETEKRKPAQGGLHGVLGYFQSAENPKKGDSIALLKVDPFIRPCSYYSKCYCFFQLRKLKGKNNNQISGEQS